MAAKKKDWADLLGKGSSPSSPTVTVAPDQPQQPPTTVLMHTIVGNPDNPRPELDYSDDDPEFRELKASMREIGQLQPLAVVSRHVFEKAKPEAVAHASPKVRKLIEAAEWIVVTGNRRLAAARQLGWTRIDIRVQDQLGDEDGRIDEAVLIENIHRKNLAPIKEAEALAVMIKRHGSQEKVAERIGKSQMFVSQRLALLNLAPDIQEEVDAGSLKIKDARRIARIDDPEKQRTEAAEAKARAAAPKVRTSTTPSVQNPVLNQAPDAAPPSASTAESATTGTAAQNPVLEEAPPEAEQQPDGIPEQRHEAAEAQVEAGPLKRFPYNDGVTAAQYLIHKMPPDEFEKMLDRLIEHRQSVDAN
ncbi:ParB/RepB/Spo0J family partition protein [Streptomyces pharetrae]|jgi:ParB family chromosome partitioning protein|uniref:ParB/RepB/Spo0J family partition protein n=1 Tax=Streptomyces pharetrae TaxID=291370 RepID=UPI003460ACA9